MLTANPVTAARLLRDVDQALTFYTLEPLFAVLGAIAGPTITAVGIKAAWFRLGTFAPHLAKRKCEPARKPGCIDGQKIGEVGYSASRNSRFWFRSVGGELDFRARTADDIVLLLRKAL